MITEMIHPLPEKLKQYQPYPSADDRSAWLALETDIKETLVRNGEQALSQDFQPLKASDFMEYSRSGNRVNYETVLFGKRIQINNLILAECVEYRGRFLDSIIDGLFSICEETAWQLPAHNSYIRDTQTLVLPDTRRPVLDLFAAETGAVLATAIYLLRQRLDQISPVICTMVEDKLEERIFRPYFDFHFWWMGDGISHMNNWTAWCTQNVLLAATLSGQPENRIREIAEKAAVSLDYFLDEYGQDGCCDEGAQYYRHAGLCLYLGLDILDTITDGKLSSCFQTKKIFNMAEYISKVHVHGPYYINFADCSPIAGRCNSREFLFGKKTSNPSLMAFAAADYRESEDPFLKTEHSLFYRLQSVFTAKELRSFSVNASPVEDIFYESAEVFIARDSRFCLAVKAGDNDDSHNHNDAGSFTIYKDGLPMFIDVGVESYTKKTFSPQRYEIWTMQSQYHNLPTFQGVMQTAGPDFKACGTEYWISPEKSQIFMDIARAYDDMRIKSYERTVTFYKEDHITISDICRTDGLETVLSLMTCEKPVLQGNILTVGDLGTCEIEGAATITIEEIKITDKRLKTAWTHSIYRSQILFSKDRLTLLIR